MCAGLDGRNRESVSVHALAHEGDEGAPGTHGTRIYIHSLKRYRGRARDQGGPRCLEHVCNSHANHGIPPRSYRVNDGTLKSAKTSPMIAENTGPADEYDIYGVSFKPTYTSASGSLTGANPMREAR